MEVEVEELDENRGNADHHAGDRVVEDLGVGKDLAPARLPASEAKAAVSCGRSTRPSPIRRQWTESYRRPSRGRSTSSPARAASSCASSAERLHERRGARGGLPGTTGEKVDAEAYERAWGLAPGSLGSGGGPSLSVWLGPPDLGNQRSPTVSPRLWTVASSTRSGPGSKRALGCRMRSATRSRKGLATSTGPWRRRRCATRSRRQEMSWLWKTSVAAPEGGGRHLEPEVDVVLLLDGHGASSLREKCRERRVARNPERPEAEKIALRTYYDERFPPTGSIRAGPSIEATGPKVELDALSADDVLAAVVGSRD